jgi:queuine tRNA-ribosyltransferase
MITFNIKTKDATSFARTGELQTPHGTIPTPVFMPVGTQATVKTLRKDEVEQVSEGLILANTYHLWLQPGHEIVRAHGGVHGFSKWPHALLTDSGGYQVFSLQDNRKIIEEGVHFRHHKSGEALFLSPELAIEIQEALGADIIMSFDECPDFHADDTYMKESVERTLRWAKRGKDHLTTDQALFGIIQGGGNLALREHCLNELETMNFPGLSIGGLSVGESKEDMLRVLDHLAPLLPKAKPHYLMGVGDPIDLLDGVRRGIDMFDCVLPTRLARHGTALTASGKVVIKNQQYEADPSPLDSDCDCEVCTTYSRSYLRHLFKAGEQLGPRLVSFHNLYFLKQLMAGIRQSITEGRFDEFDLAFRKKYFNE